AEGRLVWHKNMLEDNEADRVMWGMTSSPLVVSPLPAGPDGAADRLVLVNAGVGKSNNVARSLVAYKADTGERVWGAGEHQAGSSSPQLATLNGVRQVLLFDAAGLAGYEIKTGKELWRHEWKTGMDMNIVQPLVIGPDRVFLSSELSNGCALLRMTKSN